MIADILSQKNTWTHTTLNDFCGQRGQNIEPSKTPDLKFELYSVPSFPTRHPEIVSGKEVGSNKQIVTSESVLLCKINPRINRAWVVGQFSQHTKIASTEWIVFPPDKRVEPRFVCYFLQQNAVRDFLASNVSGVGGSLMRVKPSTLRDFPFAYPDRYNQQLIVAEIEKQFSRLDEAVTNLTRVKANLKRYKAAVLKAAVEGKLTEDWRKKHLEVEPASKLLERILAERRAKWNGRGKYKEPASPGISDLPNIPDGWVWASVESLSTKVVDGVHKKPDYVSAGVPFVTVRNLTAGPGINLEDLNYVTKEDHASFSKRADPEQGDILISKDGTLGVVRVVRTKATFSIFVSVAMIKPVLKQMSDYLGVALLSPQVQMQMVPKGSGLQHIHLEDLRADCVPVPPLGEQQQIVAEVERRLSVIDELEAAVEANLTRADRLRQSVLRSAFSGGLVDRNKRTANSDRQIVPTDSATMSPF